MKLPLHIVVLVATLFLSACSVAERITNPRPYGLAETPKGSPMFQKGWDEGCESGLTVYGNDVYKAAYGWKQDPELVLNDEYYRSWKEAYTYCRWYAYNWVRNAR